MRIVVALSRFPYPIEKGDKLRAFRQIQGLSENHTIHLVALNHTVPGEEEIRELRKYCESVDVIVSGKWKKLRNLFRSLFTRIPFQVHYFQSATMQARIRKVCEQVKPDVMFVQLIRLGLSIPLDIKIPMYIDYMDSFSAGMRNRIPLIPWYARPIAKWEARRLEKYEMGLLQAFSGYSMITAADLPGFPETQRKNFDIIPNGVSPEFIGYKCPDSIPEYDIIFTGNLGYHPNILAAMFLVREILPKVREKYPDLKVCLAGARPVKEIQALAGKNVVVTGFVSDLREYIAKSMMFVAPMISGSGLQNKLLEAMAIGLPSVTSSLANRALGAESGNHLLVCDTADEFAREIISLMGDRGRAVKLGMSGRKFVEANFDWNRSNEMLEKALIRICKMNTTQYIK